MGPIHPALVHFPITLTLVSVAADLYGAVTKKPIARVVGFWTLVAATLGANAAVIAGLYDMEKAAGHVDLVHVHMWLGIALLIILFAATLWRFRLYRRGGGIGPYAVAAPAFAIGIIAQGWLGGELVYANGVGVALKGGSPSGHDHEAPAAAEGDVRRSVGEGEREGAGHAHDASPTRRVAGSSAEDHSAHGAASNAPARSANEVHDATASTSPSSDEHGQHGHGATSSPPAWAGRDPGTTNDHSGHAAAPSASSSPSAARPSGVSEAPTAAPTSQPPAATNTTRTASPSMMFPSAAPAMSISGAPWPAAPMPRRPPRTATHPASPHAPTAPSYAPPASLSPVPLLPIDDATSSEQPRPPEAGPTDHDAMEHAP